MDSISVGRTSISDPVTNEVTGFFIFLVIPLLFSAIIEIIQYKNASTKLDGTVKEGIMMERTNLKTALQKPEAKRLISLLYGDADAVLLHQQSRYLRLSDLFHAQFPSHTDIRIFSTSGRTEIGGNHTDHQQGHVLCAAIDLDIIAIAVPNKENIIRIKSEGYNQMDVVDLSTLTPLPHESYHSASLIRGVVADIKNRGYAIGGFDAYTASSIPKGSGLSSSAAFEVLTATILNAFYNDCAISSVTMALAAQHAETAYFGKPSGLMDQCACAMGGLMTIDFKTPDLPVMESIPARFDRFGHSLVITNTGSSHADLNEDYASIPRDMAKIAAFFGKNILSEVTFEQVLDAIPALRAKAGDKSILRAMHYFTDDRRVALEAAALRNNQFDMFLQLVNESGISSWTCLQNVYSLKSPEEQPVALGLALSRRILSGQGACRVHGGGFAGTIQAFVPNDLVSDYVHAMESVFGKDASLCLHVRNLPSTELDFNGSSGVGAR